MQWGLSFSAGMGHRPSARRAQAWQACVSASQAAQDPARTHPAQVAERGRCTCRLVDPADPWAAKRAFLEEVLLASFEARQLQTRAVTAMPLYPTEAILWDDNQVPDMHYTGAPGPSAVHPNRGLLLL